MEGKRETVERGRGEGCADHVATRRRRLLRTVAGLAAVAAMALLPGVASGFEARSLTGAGNNLAHPDWGAVGQPYTRLAPADYADGAGQMVEGPEPALCQQPRLQLARRRPLLRAQRQPVGLGLGPVPGPQLRPRRTGQDDAPIPFDAPIRSSASKTRSDRSRSRATPSRPAPAPVRPIPASRSTRSTPTSTPGRSTAARPAPGMDAHRTRRRQPRARGRDAAADRKVPAAASARGDARRRRRWTTEGALAGDPRTRSSPETCGPTRTSS